ncbi:MAG: hypothetical protein JWN03_3135 [Nocardia sp.]|uniref:hypothetical protein n=1 Tax=Nocardia sp. TaxID=1821 RepID=UPI0026332A41|nr:hypothetical protein [Nocardia sp.]MCU1642860.1 hypothetical protein [Nocardia sp.]
MRKLVVAVVAVGTGGALTGAAAPAHALAWGDMTISASCKIYIPGNADVMVTVKNVGTDIAYAVTARYEAPDMGTGMGSRTFGNFGIGSSDRAIVGAAHKRYYRVVADVYSQGGEPNMANNSIDTVVDCGDGFPTP